MEYSREDEQKCGTNEEECEGMIPFSAPSSLALLMGFPDQRDRNASHLASMPDFAETQIMIQEEFSSTTEPNDTYMKSNTPQERQLDRTLSWDINAHKTSSLRTDLNDHKRDPEMTSEKNALQKSAFSDGSHSRQVVQALLQGRCCETPIVQLCHASVDTVEKEFHSIEAAMRYSTLSIEGMLLRLIAGLMPGKPFYWRLAKNGKESRSTDDAAADCSTSFVEDNDQDSFGDVLHFQNDFTSNIEADFRSHSNTMGSSEGSARRNIELLKVDSKRGSNTEKDVVIALGSSPPKKLTMRKSNKSSKTAPFAARHDSDASKYCKPKATWNHIGTSIRIDKICKKTLSIVEVFASKKSAMKSVGVTGKETFNRIPSDGTLEYRGFYWRYSSKRVAPGSLEALKPIKYIRERPKKPVEKVCVSSGDVVETFNSIAAAERSIALTYKSIRDLIDRGPFEHDGFIWRVASSVAFDEKNCTKSVVVHPREMIPGEESSAEAETFVNSFNQSARYINCGQPMPIDKICMKTLKIIGEFSSILTAMKSVGSSSGSLINGAISCGTVGYRGFYWRYSSKRVAPGSLEALEPIAYIGKRPNKPVEKVCVASGDVVETFNSIAAAARSMGVSDQTTRKRISRGPFEHDGFIWRLATNSGKANTAAHHPTEAPVIEV